MSDISDFVKWLQEKNYLIAEKHPDHVPGEGYSAPPYIIYDPVDVLAEFINETQ